ncbi:hypothetical protein Fmac_024917 [Flemingia macrophylla]|uniref:Uncharacterized protein n=1 Tax=Flemingia macrophylla TaxID=520843 RepID=A0ABD1LQR4_9FABA
MSILRLMLQTSIAGHHNSRGQTLDKKMVPTPRSFGARNATIVIRGGHHVATDTSAETRKVVGKLDALVNQKPSSIARQATIAAKARHLIRRWLPTSSSFGARNDVIAIRGVPDVATDTYIETRKVEGELDALVNLVTQLAVNQNLSLLQEYVASVIPMTTIQMSVLLQPGVNEHPERRWLPTPSSFNPINDVIVIRGVHDVTTDRSAEARKVEGKLDALMNLVTQLAVNQKPASVAIVCGIRSSDDHHTNVCPSS